MHLLHSTIRDYAWGSTTLLADLQGHEPSGRPEAELWMGAHPADPSAAVPVGQPQSTPVRLDELIAASPQQALGPAAALGRLPFLVKLLAAGTPLSIQAHPNLDQAREGFAAEQAAGIPVEAPHRNYRDDNHKPEMIVALTPFAALCGFRAPGASARSFERLAGALTEYADGDTTPAAAAAARISLQLDGGDIATPFAALLDPSGDWAGGTGVDEAVAALSCSPQARDEDLNLGTAVGLAEHFPGDPGLLVSLLLNRMDLAAGQAIHLPAGNVHAYLHGLGVEVMAASDNVLRGGLTGKHVDVAELERVVRFEALPLPYCEPVPQAAGVQVFRPPFEEFQLQRLDVPDADGATLDAHGPVIAVCTAGTVRLRSGEQTAELAPGQSVFLAASDAPATVHGGGPDAERGQLGAEVPHRPDGGATLFSVTLPAD